MIRNQRVWKWASLLCTAVALFTVEHSAFAAAIIDGTVAGRSEKCRNRFAVLAPSGYVILEWVGGEEPRDGARASGTLERYGPTYITLDGRRSQVFVSDYRLSQAASDRRLNEAC